MACRFPSTLASLAMFVVLGIGAAPAQAAAGSAPGSSSRQVRQAFRFWTAARMRQARPLSSQPTATSLIARSSEPVTAAQSPHGYPPRASSAAQSSSTFQPIPDPTLAGNSQNGAVFIVLGHGEGVARCSGTSVNAANLSVVFTAGHCVNSGGPGGKWFSQEWVFVPGYHNGERPFGAFVAKWLGTTHQWLASGNENYDVGAAVVSRNEGGKRLAAAVGADGIAWGLPPSQVFDIYGYPVGTPFNGASQRVCAQAAYEGHDVASFEWPGPLNLAVQCDVSGGASGGGWVIHGGLLNGVTDYQYPADPATDYGSYFGAAVGRLFNRAAKVR